MNDSSPGTGARLRYGISRRLDFLDFRLFWDGAVNRGSLVEAFGISVPQASADLARYKELRPENLHYDGSQKSYVARAPFEPLRAPSASLYLAQLRMLADGILERADAWLGWVPPFLAVPLVRRRLDAWTLRAVVGAVKRRRALHVCYRSMTSEGAEWRWISPHGLVFDGRRWHARAWCHKKARFSDFVMSRISEVGGTKERERSGEEDRAWSQVVTLRIGPHPGLTPAQRQAVELDFDMRDGVVEVETRLCLAFYVERQLGLDLPLDVLEPTRLQVVLLNRNDLEDLRRRFGD